MGFAEHSGLKDMETYVFWWNGLRVQCEPGGNVPSFVLNAGTSKVKRCKSLG